MANSTKGNLLPNTANTPLDARARVATLAGVANIQNPELGGIFYCTTTGKHYKITALKSKTVGAIAVEDVAVDTYEALPDADDLTQIEDSVENALKAVEESLDNKAAANHTHKAEDITDLPDLSGLDDLEKKKHTHENQSTLDKFSESEDGTPLFNGEEIKAGGGAVPAASISLPVPYDKDGNNISLIFDVSADPTFTGFRRILMTQYYEKMKVFSNQGFVDLTEKYLGVPYYGATLVFTLDTEMFPAYVPGNIYYARYTWYDSDTGDWKGFKFSGDVADMEPIRTNYEDIPTVKAETSIGSGSLSLDYLNGEIQNYKASMGSNGVLTIDLENVANVPFGEALICNIKLSNGTLKVVNGSNSQEYTEAKSYMVVVTNFGTMQIAVTENI